MSARQQFPPDRDPELRRLFALDADAQRAVLSTWVGGRAAPQPGISSTPNFRPLGLSVKRTARGVLSCVPEPFPDDAVLSADRTELCFLVEQWTFRARRAPRTPETIADLEAAITAHGDKRGIVTVPFPPPRRWTIETLRAAIRTLILHVPASASDKPNRDFCVHVSPAAGYLRHDIISVSPYTEPFAQSEDGPFSAEVRLTPDATDAIKQWHGRLPNYWPFWPLSDIDRRLQRSDGSSDAAANEARADEDDDDLDVVELTARRTLRGERTGLSRKAAQLEAFNPDAARGLEKIIDVFLARRTGSGDA